jgi:hypothetical protein
MSKAFNIAAVGLDAAFATPLSRTTTRVEDDGFMVEIWYSGRKKIVLPAEIERQFLILSQ